MDLKSAYYTAREACERQRRSRRYLYELRSRSDLQSLTAGRARRIVAPSVDAPSRRHPTEPRTSEEVA